jgi:hypothetical protein
MVDVSLWMPTAEQNVCGAVDPAVLGTYGGISRLDGEEWELYSIRKGYGAEPWGTETLWVDRVSGAIYQTDETTYGPGRAVRNQRTFWRWVAGAPVPGVLWMPLSIAEAGEDFRELGVGVEHLLELSADGRPTGASGPLVEWPPETRNDARCRAQYLGPLDFLGGCEVIQSTDRMGVEPRANVEIYWLARTPSGPVIYSRWINEPYGQGRVADSLAIALMDLGPPCKVRALCPDGRLRWLGTPGFGPVAEVPEEARRPTLRVEAEKPKKENKWTGWI